MKTLNQLLKDRKVQNALIVVLLVWAISSSQPITQAVYQPESVCDDIGIGFGIWDNCLSKGCVVWKGGFTDCKSCIPTGERTQRDVVYDRQPSKWNSDICCSGYWKELDDASDFVGTQKGAICLDETSADASKSESCNQVEQGIAKPVMDMFKISNCKTAYYMTLGGTVMIFMLFIAII